jgi:hypothetical protein
VEEKEGLDGGEIGCGHRIGAIMKPTSKIKFSFTFRNGKKNNTGNDFCIFWIRVKNRPDVCIIQKFIGHIT